MNVGILGALFLFFMFFLVFCWPIWLVLLFILFRRARMVKKWLFAILGIVVCCIVYYLANHLSGVLMRSIGDPRSHPDQVPFISLIVVVSFVAEILISLWALTFLAKRFFAKE